MVRQLRASLRVLEREVQRMASDQASCCGVSVAQCHALLELEQTGCTSLNGLAERTGLDKSTLSRTVDGLVRAGLVQRSDDPENRRQQVICLSETGVSRVEAINQWCDTWYTEMLADMETDQLEQVRGTLELVASFLVRHRKDNDHGKFSCC